MIQNNALCHPVSTIFRWYSQQYQSSKIDILTLVLLLLILKIMLRILNMSISCTDVGTMCVSDNGYDFLLTCWTCRTSSWLGHLPGLEPQRLRLTIWLGSFKSNPQLTPKLSFIMYHVCRPTWKWLSVMLAICLGGVRNFAWQQFSRNCCHTIL